MANIKLKSSAVTGKVPLTTDLAYGELALNYADRKLYFKSSVNSIESFVVGSGSGSVTGTQYDRQTYTATAAQTTFSVAYDLVSSKPLIQVYINGVLIDSSEYTANNGISVTLTTGAALGALVECIGYKNLYITALTTSGAGLSYSTAGTIILNSDAAATGSTVAVRDVSGGLTATTFNGSLNGSIIPRTVTIADGTSITVNINTTDIAVQTNTQAAGTLTINAVTGTYINGQKFVIRLQTTNMQTLSWNAIFTGSTDLALPVSSSGGNKYDYIGFIYNSTAAKWQLLAKNFGF